MWGARIFEYLEQKGQLPYRRGLKRKVAANVVASLGGRIVRNVTP